GVGKEYKLRDTRKKQEATLSTSPGSKDIADCGFGIVANSVADQKAGEKTQGIAHYFPATKAVRDKSRQKWLDWGERPARLFESAVLPEGMKEMIIQDLDQWVSSKQKSFEDVVGYLHKRSFLILGPPSSGKNSAIASKWGLGVYSIPLGNVAWTDDDFLDVIQSVTGLCIIVLLDELDTVFRRQQQAPLHGVFQGVSQGVILSFMDGPYSKSDVLTISLASERRYFPEAFLRPGRVDQTFQLGEVSQADG
ncbi:MAG: hypothetical protein Q9207_007919, partial [Kuettlingeria erythrocarpa]